MVDFTKMTGLGNDYIYIKLEAHATSPYEETLRGEFKINIGNLGMSYVVEDEAYRPDLEVRITNTLDYYIVDDEHSIRDLLNMIISNKNQQKKSYFIKKH